MGRYVCPLAAVKHPSSFLISCSESLRAVDQVLANHRMVVLHFHPEVDTLSLPSDDRNIIASVSYYSPFEFTHPGASWTNQKDKLGVLWEATPAKQAAVRKELRQVQCLFQKGAPADLPRRVRPLRQGRDAVVRPLRRIRLPRG